MADRRPEGEAPGPATSQKGSETRIELSPGRRDREGMRRIPGGRFRMGSEDFYPDERPVHEVAVDGFWMDEHPVTNAEFRRFVKETGYVTVAERPLDPADYPDADPDLLVPGSLVFQKTSRPVDLNDYRNWWAYVPSAPLAPPGRAGDDAFMGVAITPWSTWRGRTPRPMPDG